MHSSEAESCTNNDFKIWNWTMIKRDPYMPHIQWKPYSSHVKALTKTSKDLSIALLYIVKDTQMIIVQMNGCKLLYIAKDSN